MADRLNPAERTAAESDYEKKFNRDVAAETKELKEKETAPDATWKTVTTKKQSDDKGGNGRFRFAGRRAGALRNGSAFMFVISIIVIGVAYTSVFAPNIILVNLKEMYTNDLADATLALNTYYWKLMNYKIGRSDCGDQQSIKCKLTTMSRAQKQAFEKNGFTVLGTKVKEDNRDDGQPGNELPESRYEVTAILPPKYKQTIDDLKNTGLSWLTGGFNGGIQNVMSQFNNISQDAMQNYSKDFLSDLPIATGDMLWLYSQLSSGTKAQVYSVFNPKSSFFLDTRFKSRLKEKYGINKSMDIGGETEQEVNQSFDATMNAGSGGVGIDGEPSKDGGIDLAALANPTTAVQVELAARNLSNLSSSYVGLQCSWYALGNAVTNDAKTAKAHTLARFAMEYLKAADDIKVGTSDDITINTLSSKLADSVGGGYNGANATDSSLYKSIVYGSLPIPSPYGFLYYEDTFDLIGALIPAWSQIMASSAAEGQASGVSGQLSMPPAELTGSARDYCLGGETQQNHTPYKTPDVECQPQITASAPPGTEGLVSQALQLARQTCPVHHYDNTDRQFEGGPYNVQPSLKATDLPLTTYVAGLFSANVIAWANVIKPFFSSNTKGVAASDAIFAGTGEILGDMAMSRGMEPANAATLGVYIAQQQQSQKDFNDVARYNAKSQPFDIYNQFSFLGSIVHNLSPTYNAKTPLFSTIANAFSLVGGSVKQLDKNANAFYYMQPEIPEIDPLNPAVTGAQHAAGIAQYMLRLSCPDPEYLAIGIMADTACNVRYVMGKQEMLASPDSVLNYMEQSHSDLTQDNINELQQRLAQADAEDGDKANITRMLTSAQQAANQPEIDKETGKAIPGSEYEKYLNYCVNRQDPWGRSGVAVTYNGISNDERTKRQSDKQSLINPISPSDSGDPYQETPGLATPSISEGAKADQDWYTGKKCLDTSDELTNFRAYTMLCSVDGSLSGGVDCTDNDNSVGTAYSNNFYTSNDIEYLGWD